MELKPNRSIHVSRRTALLIVPYGIETNTDAATEAQRKYLLIVPYGIETR